MYYTAHPQLVEISQLLEKVSFYHREKMYVQYMQAIDSLLKTFLDEKKADYGTKKSVAEFLSQTLPCQIKPEQAISEWRRMLQNSGEQMLLAQLKKEHVDLLAQVLLFIEQNYQSDIGIAQIEKCCM